MRHITSHANTVRGRPLALSAIALPCLVAMVVVVGGCAKPESRSWAQTSPVIMPEKRPAADSTVQRSSPRDMPGTATYADSSTSALELN